MSSDTGTSPASRIDPAQTREERVLKHARALFSCRFDPTGRFIFAGTHGNVVRRWELYKDLPGELVGHESWVRSIAFLPGGGCLFTGGYDGRVSCWPCEASASTPAWSIEAHQGWVRSVSVSPDGQLLATAGNDKLVRFWSAADGKLVRELAGHTSHVYNTAFHPSGLHLASADLKGAVKHWEVASGKFVRDLDAALLYKYDGTFRADIGGARGMAFSPDGRFLACTGITEVTNAFAGVGNPLVILFDWLTGQRKELLRPKEGFQGVAWGVAFHPAGFVIGVGGGGGGALWFWKPDQPQAFFTLKLPTAARDLDLHPDGRHLAIALYDGTLRIYDMSAAS